MTIASVLPRETLNLEPSDGCWDRGPNSWARRRLEFLSVQERATLNRARQLLSKRTLGSDEKTRGRLQRAAELHDQLQAIAIEKLRLELL